MIHTKEAVKGNPKAVIGETLFSQKLYADTLRGLRFTGLTLTLVSLLITLAQLLPELGNDGFALNPNVFGNVPTVFALLSPAVLMLQTFFFLYRRNGSDLYHGLPYTRRCLGLSLTAASLTWSCAAVTLPLVVCAVLIPFSPAAFPMAILGWMLVHHLVVVLLITGCALIGASLSGTPITGVLIAGMALFLPRWAMTIYRFFLANVSGMMAYNDTNWLISPALHLPTADLVLLTRQGEIPRFLGMTYTQFFHNVPGILYTLALSVVALTIGLWCFVRRRSEWAGQPLARAWQRSALLGTVAFTGLLYALYILYQANRYHRSGWMTDPSLIWKMGAAIAVCFILYLAFMWYRAKSWRGALKAAPLMAVAIACGLAVCWGGAEAGLQTRNHLPETSQIASVRFPSDPGDRDVFFGWQNGLNQLADQVSDVRYDAPEMREFVAAALSNRAAMLQEDWPDLGRPVTIEVLLADGKSLRRTVDLSEEEAETLQQRLLASPEFMSALRQTPESPRLMLSSFEVASLPDDAATSAMWQAYQAELDALSDLDFARHTELEYYLSSRVKREDHYGNDQFRYKANLRVFTWNGMDMCSNTYFVGPKTPETLDTTVREITRLWGAAYQQALEEAFAVDFQQDLVNYSMEFTYMAKVNGRDQQLNAYLYPLPSWEDLYRDAYVEEALDRETYEAYRVDEDRQLREILTRSPLAEDGQEPLVAAYVHVTVRQDGGGNKAQNGFAYLKVSDADFALLQEIHQRRAQ